ncbi:acyltransferase [Sphingomonas sp. AP4-R1]|uniref:acyltransferase family protein n=1 Tax=Sphingomonas sp. AP4-R1 TaxID=2735134 RepID=UPI0014939E0A|nr:acyltransferase [Sphingomonas sp. AP4-R1]QJU57265.1 acyltransferase [Sphingomonas sp. AP4-R1]
MGFDYLRLTLALLVIILHAPFVVRGQAGVDSVWNDSFMPLFRLVVPMFFALSGFLVAGSFERCRTMLMFFGLRAIRIFPALAVETVISALILGPLLTEFTLGRYFSDPLFARYALNMLGEPQYFLPGVFAHNPFPDMVNGQLWTIPFELFCYISIGIIALFRARKYPVVAPLATVAATLVYLVARYIHWGSLPDIHRSLAGPLLIPCFLAGVSLYLYRHVIPATHALGIVSLAISALFLAIPGLPQFLAPWPLAYATAYLGCLKLPRTWFSAGADYSYGIYLYGFPVQQMVVYFTFSRDSLLLNVVASVAICTAIAAFSWRFIEKPALKLKTNLSAVEKKWLAWHGARRAGLLAAEAEL